MRQHHRRRSLGYLFAAISLGSCAAEEQPHPKDGPVDSASRSPASSASEDRGEGQAPAASDAGRQTQTFESLGLLSCQTAGPSERFEAPLCSSATLDCEASLVQRLQQLAEACAYVLNENSLELFFDQGCAVGMTVGRADPDITTEAARCLAEQVAKLRVGCPRPLCVRLEHSTLAAAQRWGWPYGARSYTRT